MSIHAWEAVEPLPSQEALAGGRPMTMRLVQVRKESDLSGRKLVGLAGGTMTHHQDGCRAKGWKEIGKLIGTSPAWKWCRRLRGRGPGTYDAFVMIRKDGKGARAWRASGVGW